MEGLVNYSSEDDREDSPRRNAADHYLAHENDPNRRSRGDSSRRPREEKFGGSTNDRNGGSTHRDKDAGYGSLKKNSHKEDSRNAGRSSNRDHHHRTDRRPERPYDKKRDSKDDRKRRDGHRDRDREYEHRDVDRDRRDRSDRHRRDRYDKDNSYRDKDRRRRSSESPSSSSKDRNASSSHHNRNKSRSRSPPKDYASYSKINSTTPTADSTFRGEKQPRFDQKEETLNAPPLSVPKALPSSQAVLTLPLNDAPSKMPNFPNKAEAPPIALPTYYNPNIINPTKYAEQVQKRKLIWGAKKAEDTSAKWGHATFSEDSDGKVASKFMRLMGIKSAPKPAEAAAIETATTGEKKGPDVKSRQAMFSNMEQQYEVARQVTHTMRGVGLGFGSQSRQY